MEEVPFHPLIIVTKEEMRAARSAYGLDDLERIKQAVEDLREWLQKQDHIVEKNINQSLMERFFLLARGSIEGTKTKIDKLFTLRGMSPDLTLNRSIDEFEKFNKCVRYIALPKLAPDQSRVMITQFLTEDLENFTLQTYFRYCYFFADYRVNLDYSLGDSFIIDLRNIKLSVLSKLNPVVIKKAEVLCTEGYGTRVMGIHILNAPAFVDKLVFILKQGLKEKVASRLHVHNTFEDLQKYIPKKILPSDFGGEERSMDKLAAEWDEELHTKKARALIDASNRLTTDESKRQALQFNQEYLGMPGSFRKLTVD